MFTIAKCAFVALQWVIVGNRLVSAAGRYRGRCAIFTWHLPSYVPASAAKLQQTCYKCAPEERKNEA
jgi:hypothetical protein